MGRKALIEGPVSRTPSRFVARLDCEYSAKAGYTKGFVDIYLVPSLPWRGNTTEFEENFTPYDTFDSDVTKTSPVFTSDSSAVELNCRSNTVTAKPRRIIL
jgi:hypothetical protein